MRNYFRNPAKCKIDTNTTNVNFVGGWLIWAQHLGFPKPEAVCDQLCLRPKILRRWQYALTSPTDPIQRAVNADLSLVAILRRSRCNRATDLQTTQSIQLAAICEETCRMRILRWSLQACSALKQSARGFAGSVEANAWSQSKACSIFYSYRWNLSSLEDNWPNQSSDARVKDKVQIKSPLSQISRIAAATTNSALKVRTAWPEHQIRVQ